MEALDKNKAESARAVLIQQFLIMERRLWYGITWPSCLMTILLGTSLAYHYLPLSENPWLMAKLLLVGTLVLYHIQCGQLYRKLKAGQCRWGPMQLRLWNEVATVFLVAIIFVAVLKDALSWKWALGGTVALILALALGIRIYRQKRNPPR